MQETHSRIEKLRAEYGEDVIILGHHYQRKEVLRHADFRGDSLELARKAADSGKAGRIVFCGVRFMAESADILSDPEQKVYLAEKNAGCPMADMLAAEDAETAWERLRRVSTDWTPIVYVNSSVAAKAFCGENDGSACTSSNARRVLSYYVNRKRRVLFMPDEHLGRNTAQRLGIPDNLIGVYDPSLPDGGLTDTELHKLQILLWKGYCPIHTAFTLGDVERMREEHPEAHIIVHPETPAEVVRAVDSSGSTGKIVRFVEDAPEGSVIIIGTEYQLVRNLAEKHKDRLRILPLRTSVCPDMSMTRAGSLVDILENWPRESLVSVPEETAAPARICLERMLAL